MATIIDFSGYYYKDDFIIKEYCESYLQDNSKKVGVAIVTATPIEHLKDINFINNIYSIYLKKYGIPLQRSTHEIKELKERIFRVLSNSEVVFVRNKKQRRDLFNFIKIQPDHVKLLEQFNFDVSLEIMGPCCSYHIKKQGFYCARLNVQYMSSLLLKKFRGNSKRYSTISYPTPSTSKESKSEKTEPVTKTVDKNRNHAVINFNGYYNLRRTNIIIKEFSVYVFNDQGVEIYHKLLVVKPPYHRVKTNAMKDVYNYHFYNTYGIEWTAGNCIPNDVQIALTSLVKKYNIKYIFVNGVDKKQHVLHKLFFNYNNIICLSEYGYDPAQEFSASPKSKCKYHSHPHPHRNVCADYSNKIMLQWILTSKLYKDEVLNSVRNFKNLSQTQLSSKSINKPAATKARSVQSKIPPKEIAIQPKPTPTNIIYQPASFSENTSVSDQPSTSWSNQSEQVSVQRSRNLKELVNINFDVPSDSTVNDNNMVPIDFDLSDSNHNFINTIFDLIDPPAHSSINNQEIHESDLEIDDKVLDTFDVKNFVSSWSEYESEPIDLDDILSDDRSSSEQTSNSSKVKSELSDNDNDLFEKLLQSDDNSQLDDLMLDSHYQELEQFLL